MTVPTCGGPRGIKGRCTCMKRARGQSARGQRARGRTVRAGCRYPGRLWCRECPAALSLLSCRAATAALRCVSSPPGSRPAAALGKDLLSELEGSQGRSSLLDSRRPRLPERDMGPTGPCAQAGPEQAVQCGRPWPGCDLEHGGGGGLTSKNLSLLPVLTLMSQAGYRAWKPPLPCISLWPGSPLSPETQVLGSSLSSGAITAPSNLGSLCWQFSEQLTPAAQDISTWAAPPAGVFSFRTGCSVTLFSKLPRRTQRSTAL